MVNVVPKNEKLKQRAIGILESASVPMPKWPGARLYLGSRTPVALVMLVLGTRARAVAALKKASAMSGKRSHFKTKVIALFCILA